MAAIASAIKTEELSHTPSGDIHLSQLRNETDVINSLDNDDLITNLAIQVPTIVRVTSKKKGTSLRGMD